MRGALVVLVLVGLSACAAGESASTGTVVVRGDGVLFVDARDVGPVAHERSITLAAGTHVLELRRGRSVLASASAEVWAGGRVLVVLDSDLSHGYGADAAVSGRLDLHSAPPGAVVYVDGIMLGITPTAVDLVPGPHHLEILADGYAPFEEDLLVGAGASIVLDVALSRVDG